MSLSTYSYNNRNISWAIDVLLVYSTATYPMGVCGTAIQVTAFVALLALDARRTAECRLDVAPCIQLPRRYLGNAAAGSATDEHSAAEPLLADGTGEEAHVSTNGTASSSGELEGECCAVLLLPSLFHPHRFLFFLSQLAALAAI